VSIVQKELVGLKKYIKNLSNFVDLNCLIKKKIHKENFDCWQFLKTVSEHFHNCLKRVLETSNNRSFYKHAYYLTYYIIHTKRNMLRLESKCLQQKYDTMMSLLYHEHVFFKCLQNLATRLWKNKTSYFQNIYFVFHLIVTLIRLQKCNIFIGMKSYTPS